MSIEIGVITGLASVTAGLVSAILSSSLIRKFLRKGTFSTKNALSLLSNSRPEEWNEIRILHHEWTPDLSDLSVEEADLTGINFSDLELNGVRFQKCKLNGADFSRAHLQKVSFKDSILDDAVFLDARLHDVDLSGVTLSRADFSNAEMESSTFPQQIELNDSHNHQRISIDDLSTREFEELVGCIFKQQGYEVEKTPLTKDGGYDLTLRQSDDLVGQNLFLVEIKKYTGGREVGLGSVRALLGAVIAKSAQKGILVSTSYFSDPAKELAEKSKMIQLVDRNVINYWALKSGLLPNEHQVERSQTSPEMELINTLMNSVKAVQNYAVSRKATCRKMGVFFLFSTAKGDAWLMEMIDSDCVQVAKEGKKLEPPIDENSETIVIDWSHTFSMHNKRLEITAYSDKRVQQLTDAPVRELYAAIRRIRMRFTQEQHEKGNASTSI